MLVWLVRVERQVPPLLFTLARMASPQSRRRGRSGRVTGAVLNADAQALQGVDAQLSQEQLATLDGQVFLQEGLQSAVERQAVLDAEMERLRQERLRLRGQKEQLR